MADKHTTLYRVGWLATDDSPAAHERLTILGDYPAGHAGAAVKLALEDGANNGGVPGTTGQRMVAVPVSRWSEFAGMARQRTEWELTPIDDGDQTTLDEAD